MSKTYIYGVDVFFKPGDIHTILDIGGNGGYVAAKMYEVVAPNRIISLEPCIETFEDYLCETNKDIGGVLECYNIAYGNGDDLYRLYKSSLGMTRFLTESERDYWLVDWEDFIEKYYPYPIESKTLESIFKDYNIDLDKPYFIKMDCEGCERFLLENKEDLFYMKNAAYFSAEFHFLGSDFDGTLRKDSTKAHEFASWVWDNFADSHYIVIGNRHGPRLESGMLEMEEYFSSGKLKFVKLLSKEFPWQEE
jgi:FkbM family methyltransferase